MKKRMGFVSNSSSSSFCILGVSTDEISSKVEMLDEEIDWYDRCTDGLTYEGWIDDYQDGGMIGIDPSSMKEDLTVAQNKEIVAEKINKAFGTTFTKDDIGFVDDGGHNG